MVWSFVRHPGAAGPSRLLKKANLRRWLRTRRCGVRAKYATHHALLAAWHLDLFEQPGLPGMAAFAGMTSSAPTQQRGRGGDYAAWAGR